MKSYAAILLCLLATVFSACGANLHVTNLDIALLNEDYAYQLEAVDDSWEILDSNELVFLSDSSGLPSGMYVSSDGFVFGAAQELGTYEFDVTVYAIDDFDWYEWDDWNEPYDDGVVTEDSETLTLLVTEASTNPNCPSPSNRDVNEIYVCLGSLATDSFGVDEIFDLDITYFINIDDAETLNVTSVGFSITYDSSLFALDDNMLNSQILREAATYADATVTFDNSTSGILYVQLDSSSEYFDKPGRILDLPFYALQDIPLGSSTFTVSMEQISSETEILLETPWLGIDGSLTLAESE